MSLFENHAGFTISGIKLQVVEVISSDQHFLLENIDEAYFNESINFQTDKETKIISLIQGAFNELLIRKPLKSKIVSFALPFDLCYVLQIPYDNSLLHQDLIEEFKWEFSVLYPFLSPKDLAIQYLEIYKNIFIDNMTAIIYATERKYLKILHKFCQDNNLNLKFVDNVHLASDRALAANYPKKSNGFILSIYFVNKFLSIILLQNSKPVFHKVYPLQNANEIPELILKEINSEKLKVNKYSVDRAFISGEELSSSIADTLSKNLGIEFIYLNPFKNIKPNSDLESNKLLMEKFNAFSPAAGIAYRLA
jgi:Tfp pilus assembly PilM family ATPase